MASLRGTPRWCDHDEPGEFDLSDQCYGFDEAGAIPVEVEAGSVVFFNGYMVHKSHKNRSDIYRRGPGQPLLQCMVAPTVGADQAGAGK